MAKFQVFFFFLGGGGGGGGGGYPLERPLLPSRLVK